MTKKIKNYKFGGLGFPVILNEVEIKLIAGEQVPTVNMRKLQDAAFEVLLHLPVNLTGAQIRFIRSFMGMTLGEFGRAVGYSSHTKPSQWEKAGQNSAKLSVHAELAIRIVMTKFLGRESISVAEGVEILAGKLESSKPIRLKSA